MKQKRTILRIALPLAVIAAAAGLLLFLSRERQNEVRLQMTAAAATEAAVPTATPAEAVLPSPTTIPEEEPTEEPSPEPSPTPDLDPADWKKWPELPESISPEIKAMYFEGISEGNSESRFSKVGDSNTVMPSFFGCFDSGADTGYVLGPYAYLQETVEHFQWSFSRNSRAAKNGATAYDMDVYHWYDDDVCWPYESALNCEYRLYTPSIAFIGFGTNDAYLGIDLYESHLRSLVEKTLARKIVPILFTKADDLEGDGSFNAVTAKIAKEFNVPLWNLWLPMSQLPNNGLREGDVHPTANDVNLCNFSGDDPEQYGWTVRNLSALKALDRVWRLLNDLPYNGE